jgi:hypothetical protein
MTLVNLTPHAIVLRLPDGTDLTIPPSGQVARVAVAPAAPVVVPGIPVPVLPAPVLGEVTGLPSPADGIGFIVSGMVAQAASRPDVFAPATGPGDGAIRNAAGQVVAVTRLVSSI